MITNWQELEKSARHHWGHALQRTSDHREFLPIDRSVLDAIKLVPHALLLRFWVPEAKERIVKDDLV